MPVNQRLEQRFRRLIGCHVPPRTVIDPALVRGAWKLNSITESETPLNYALPSHQGSNHPCAEKFSHYGAVTEPPQYCLEIAGARIFGDCGVVIDQDNRLLRDSSWRSTPDRVYEYVQNLRRLPLVKRVRGRIASVAMTAPNNYYHWLVRVLPRIILAGSHCPDVYALAWARRPFQVETLLRLGVLDAVCELNTWSHLAPDAVLFPSIPSAAEACTPRIRQALRDLFIQELRVKGTANRKIYISRGDASVRRIRNENLVIRCLIDRGFEIIQLEGMGISEQASLFSTATHVVAPHGAGLTNLLFAPEGSCVLEFMPPKFFNACYWGVSQAGAQKYTYLVGEEVGGEEHKDACNRDYKMNVDEIAMSLDQLL